MSDTISKNGQEDVTHIDEIDDIIAKVPSWILRWGISLFFIVLIMIFSLSALIEYPDIVNGTLKIIALDPANSISPKISGKLDRLLVTSHEAVKAGQPLAYYSANEATNAKYIMTTSRSGRMSFSGVIYEGMAINANQVLFYVVPKQENFVGEMMIPQRNMGKIKEGQQVLVKLRSYPFEEYGMIRGKIDYISDIPYKDSVFICRVNFKVINSSDMNKSIHLTQGMTADAEIITQEATILQRLSRNFFKMMGTGNNLH
jgi:hypothetical protein